MESCACRLVQRDHRHAIRSPAGSRSLQTWTLIHMLDIKGKVLYSQTDGLMTNW